MGKFTFLLFRPLPELFFSPIRPVERPVFHRDAFRGASFHEMGKGSNRTCAKIFDALE